MACLNQAITTDSMKVRVFIRLVLGAVVCVEQLMKLLIIC